MRVGMGRPSTGPDSTWLAVLWVVDDDGVVSFEAIAPTDSPGGPPLAHLGPAFAGSLSGLIREEGGRLAIRLVPVAPPEDPDRPWTTPLAIRAALGLEPARAAALRPNELASLILDGFVQALDRVAGGRR
jgi:hypothetical protein